MPFPPDDGNGSRYPADLRALWYPTATAATAVTACQHAVRVLTVDLEQRPGWATDARDSWEGPYRREFDATFASAYGRTHDLKERIAALAAAIAAAVANVDAENRRRADGRAEYDRQQAAEAARRAAATAAAGGPS